MQKSVVQLEECKKKKCGAKKGAKTKAQNGYGVRKVCISAEDSSQSGFCMANDKKNSAHLVHKSNVNRQASLKRKASKMKVYERRKKTLTRRMNKTKAVEEKSSSEKEAMHIPLQNVSEDGSFHVGATARSAGNVCDLAKGDRKCANSRFSKTACDDLKPYYQYSDECTTIPKSELSSQVDIHDGADVEYSIANKNDEDDCSTREGSILAATLSAAKMLSHITANVKTGVKRFKNWFGGVECGAKADKAIAEIDETCIEQETDESGEMGYWGYVNNCSINRVQMSSPVPGRKHRSKTRKRRRMIYPFYEVAFHSLLTPKQ